MLRSGHGAGSAKKLEIGHGAPWSSSFLSEPFHSKNRNQRNRRFIRTQGSGERLADVPRCIFKMSPLGPPFMNDFLCA